MELFLTKLSLFSQSKGNGSCSFPLDYSPKRIQITLADTQIFFFILFSFFFFFNIVELLMFMWNILIFKCWQPIKNILNVQSAIM